MIQIPKPNLLMTLVFAAIVPWMASMAPVSAKEDHAMDEMVSKASTAADHHALGEHYDKLAKDARAEAKRHRAMAETYRKRGAAEIGKYHLDEHCERLAKSFDEVAAQNELLAKAHHEMAKADGK